MQNIISQTITSGPASAITPLIKQDLETGMKLVHDIILPLTLSRMHIRKEDLEKAWQVKAIIEKDYHKAYTVADLAQMVGTNKSTLNLAFKTITGHPVKRYIKNFRVEKARQLLETSSMAVEIIADRVGLHRTNLEKNFKKCLGKSPKEWRRNPDQSTTKPPI